MSGTIGPILPLPDGPSGATVSAAAPASRTASFLQELARAYERKMPGISGEQASASVSGQPAPVEGVGLGHPPADVSGVRPLLLAAARQEGVPPALLAAVVDQESGFNPRAVSKAGAKGLTQLMDGTARSLGVKDPFDPWQNLVGGARFLRAMLDRFHGSVPLALAAYNAGPGAVESYHGIPPYAETQTYVRRVLGFYQQYTAQFPSGGAS